MVNSRKRPVAGREPSLALRELEAVAGRLSIPIRYERGEMRGGLCRLCGRWQIIINEDLADEEKTDVLAESLAQTDLEGVFVPPRVRQRLEQARNPRFRVGEEPV
jgi:hypothetical protein